MISPPVLKKKLWWLYVSFRKINVHVNFEMHYCTETMIFYLRFDKQFNREYIAIYHLESVFRVEVSILRDFSLIDFTFATNKSDCCDILAPSFLGNEGDLDTLQEFASK